ncbi:MAG: prepilin-type N-terminal cleavage/methylation domain-containing protein [Gemmatimonadota bacterium]
MSVAGARGNSAGFTLIEVVFALVIFTVGLLGVAGMVNVAARTLNGARAMAWAVASAAEVADSLAFWGASGDGERLWPEGRVRWEVEEDGDPLRVMIEVVPVQAGVGGGGAAGSGSKRIRLSALVPAARALPLEEP